MGHEFKLSALFLVLMAAGCGEEIPVEGPDGGLEPCEFDGGLAACGTPPGPTDCDDFIEGIEIATWGGFRNDNLNNPQATAGVLVLAMRLLPEINPGTNSDWFGQHILERLVPADPNVHGWFDDVDAQHQPGGGPIAACGDLNPGRACSNAAATLFRVSERGRPADYDGDGDIDLFSAKNVFYDFHGSLGANRSFLEGEGISQCKVACEQRYVCSDERARVGQAIPGTFRIWEVYEAVKDSSVPGGIRTDVFVYVKEVGHPDWITNK